MRLGNILAPILSLYGLETIWKRRKSSMHASYRKGEEQDKLRVHIKSGVGGGQAVTVLIQRYANCAR